MSAPEPVNSGTGWSTAARIVLRGRYLPGEIPGTRNLCDMAYLEPTGRPPQAIGSRMFNPVPATEHLRCEEP